MFGKLLIAGLAGLGIYEAYEFARKRYLGGTEFLKGHNYAIHFSYTGNPIAPLGQSDAQAVLDSQAPGVFDVLGASMVNPKTIAVQAVMVASDEKISNHALSVGWPASLGTVAVENVQDMGAAPTPGS